ncbi:MAG: Flp family type IVb pilin [Acidobacteria bacterium]|nr:MAG: Flp family type IVb pilin [Acidobacteriota bacterium]PYR73987.1 MAG: Flp family type IVb pilin [Acidobacteriota bacterium]
MNLISRLRALKRNTEGQDLLEYALLVALIALVAYVGVTATGTSVNAVFHTISSKISSMPGLN